MSSKFLFADLITGPTLVPPWLLEENGIRFLTSIGIAVDALMEKRVEGQEAHMPGRGDATVIPLQAADRVMVQGPAESNASFVLRLKGAFQAWLEAGARHAVMGQIQAYLTNLQPGVVVTDPQMTIVGGNTSISTWDVLTYASPQGAPPAHTMVTPANWNWDGQDNPDRAWLILYMHLVPTGQIGTTASVSGTGGSGVAGVTSGFATLSGLTGMSTGNVQQYLTVSGAASSGNNGTFQIQSIVDPTSVVIANRSAVSPDANNGALTWSVGQYPYIGPAPVWGSPSFVWGQTHTWGVNCSPYVIQSIRQILKSWKSALTYYPDIIISFGGGDGTAGKEFSPLSSQGAGNPDGTWGGDGNNVNGVVIPAKQPLNPATSFCDGTGVSIQCYEKNFT